MILSNSETCFCSLISINELWKGIPVQRPFSLTAMIVSKPSNLSRLIVTTGFRFSCLGSQRCAQWSFKYLLVFVTRLVMQLQLQLWWIRCITLLCPVWTEKTVCPVMKTETFTVKLGGTSATVPLIRQTRQVTDRCPWMS